MVGISKEASSSRMEQLTQGRRLGFRGLLGANRHLLLTSLFACIGSFMYGTDQGILSNLLTGQNFGSKFPDVYTDPVLKGWVVSVLQLGAWLGALINGPLANAISRKYSLTVAAFVSLLSILFFSSRTRLRMLYSFLPLVVPYVPVHKTSFTSL